MFKRFFALLLLLPTLLLAQAPKVQVTTRAGAGTALTFTQADKNFTDLQHAVNASTQGWGQKETTTTGLVYGYYGGPAFSGTWISVSDGTVTLTASSTNYVERSTAGAVTANITGWTSGLVPLAKVVTGSSMITSIVDFRHSAMAGVEYLNVKNFGAKGDSNGTAGNGTNDTAAIAAAFDAAKVIGATVYFPQGIYRVTSAYVQATAAANVRIVGESRARWAEFKGSVIMLDNASAAVGFFSMTGTGGVTVEHMTFICAQYALDRWFFKFASNNTHHFTDVVFTNVERPIVYATGCYFQNASLRDVSFMNSGTIHSESKALMGTLLRLDNVNHEGSVPINTDKIVMDLQGVRDLDANTLLLEGALPAAAWTVLRFDTSTWYAAQSPGWQEMAGTITNLWSEWTVNLPTYTISLNGMSLTLQRPTIGPGIFYLNNTAQIRVYDLQMAGDNRSPEGYFTFGDIYSTADVYGTISRSFPNTNPTQIRVHNSQLIIAGVPGTIPPSVHPISFDFRQSLYKWSGGLLKTTSRFNPDTDAYNGTVRTIETNATYGRLIRINRGSSAYPLFHHRVYVTPEMVGKPLHFMIYANIPVRVGGSYTLCYPYWDGGSYSGGGGPYAVDFTGTGAYQWYRCGVTVPPSATYVEFNLNTNSGNPATDLLIAAMEVTCGVDVAPVVLPDYPAQITCPGTAAPTTGTWAVGDHVINSVSTVGQPKGWFCTVAGTPGTWVSEGNL